MLLYHARNSVCSQKVRLCLEEIGLRYDSQLLDLMAGDQLKPDYLALNPEGVVPTLVDDGRVIVESSLICSYLDRTYNGDRLMPAAFEARIMAERWLLRAIQIHAAINALTFSTANRGAKFRGMDANGREAKLAKIPNPMARLRLVSLTDEGTESPFVAQALTDLKRACAAMSESLAKSDWLCGASFSLGDIAVVAYIDRLERLGFAPLWTSGHPCILPWLERIRSRPAFTTAIDDIAPPGSFARMREAGEPFLPELQALWEAS